MRKVNFNISLSNTKKLILTKLNLNMKNVKLIATLMASLFSFVVLFTACEKDDVTSATVPDPTTLIPATVDDTKMAEDNMAAEVSYSGVFQEVNENAETTDSYRIACPSLSIVATDSTIAVNRYPKTLTVDYGATGCNDKQGKLIGVFSGRFRDSLTTVDVTFDQYVHNGYKVEASKYRITNLGKVSGKHSYRLEVENGVITKGTDTSKWATDRVYTWEEGRDTPLSRLDDVFLVTGNANGTDRTGFTYTTVVDSALRISNACKWVESGQLTVTPTGELARTVNFGNTGCDNKATLIIAGQSVEVTMP